MYKYHFDENYLSKEPLKIGDFNFRQIGRLYMRPQDSVGFHRHGDWFELTIVTNGTGNVSTNGVLTPVKRGDIYLSFPYDMHNVISSREDPLQFDYFAFTHTDGPYEKEFAKIFERYSPTERLFSDERITTLVASAMAEFHQDQVLSEDLLCLVFKQILIYVIRAFQSIKPQQFTLTTSQPETFCYQIMHYIDTHIYTIKNLDEIAVVMNYNYSYLSALFKKTTNCTILSYYQQKKLETACSLLEEGTLNVTKIAEMLNYSSPYAFSRAFSAKYNYSPKQYAKIHGKKEIERSDC